MRIVTILLGALLALLPCEAGAQATPADSSSLSSSFFGRQDLAVAGSLAAVQAALFVLDDDIYGAAARARSAATDDVAGAFRPLGRKPPWYYASAAAYAVGRIAGQARLADIGLHAFLSVALANAVTGALKGLSGRLRPVVLDGTGPGAEWVERDPDQWRFLAGWRQGGPRQSWPSGHATAAFAVAAVLSEELGGPTPWLAYPIATGVAWSRVNDAAHWATDVLMGALVGTLTARLVVRHGHRGGWLERTLLLERDPYGGGTRVGVRLR